MVTANDISTSGQSTRIESFAQTDEPLPKAMGWRDMCRAWGIQRSTFYKRQKAGVYKPFLLPRYEELSPEKPYSGEKVQAHFKGRK